MINASQNNPLVSIVMPTYNRAPFMHDALNAIQKQSYTNWELIIVDDGSTDNSAQIIQGFKPDQNQTIKLIKQKNAGAYAARANGLNHANGKYIAMYDSDDQWLPHHIQDSVTALENNPEVDWVFSAYKTIDADTKELLHENHFHDQHNNLMPFFFLKHDKRKNCNIVIDPKILICMIESAQCFAFQISVIKKEIFEKTKLRTDLRNGEDRLFAIRAVKNNATIAYINDIHLVYNVHQQNSSAVANSNPIEKSVAVYNTINSGYNDLFSQLDLNKEEIKSLNHRLAHDYFWALGYTLHWLNNQPTQAFAAFKKAFTYQPFNLKMRKTYLICKIKHLLKRTP